MANIFPKWTNALPQKLAIGLLVLAASLILGIGYYFTPKYTRVGYEALQPAPFSHAMHVQQLGMDCRYCHSFAEVSAHSNLPTSQSCMACHLQIRPTSPKLDAVRESLMTGMPVSWARIHQAPDYVYFNHAVHLNRGVSCFDCHGAVNEMTAIYQAKPQSMAWCLECHRAPENFLRPPSEVFNMAWRPPAGAKQMGTFFKKDWQVNPPTTCGGCHR